MEHDDLRRLSQELIALLKNYNLEVSNCGLILTMDAPQFNSLPASEEDRKLGIVLMNTIFDSSQIFVQIMRQTTLDDIPAETILLPPQ